MMKTVCRLFALLLAVLLPLLMCTACGDAQTPDASSSAPTTAPVTIDLSALLQNILSATSITDPLSVPTKSLENLYGIAAADVVTSACATTMDGVFPDEIIMIEAVDEAALARILEKLQVRLDDVKVQSKSYDAANYALAQACRILTRGRYAALFLSAQHETMGKLFNEA